MKELKCFYCGKIDKVEPGEVVVGLKGMPYLCGDCLTEFFEWLIEKWAEHMDSKSKEKGRKMSKSCKDCVHYVERIATLNENKKTGFCSIDVPVQSPEYCPYFEINEEKRRRHEAHNFQEKRE